jgi:hypothetical protein
MFCTSFENSRRVDNNGLDFVTRENKQITLISHGTSTVTLFVPVLPLASGPLLQLPLQYIVSSVRPSVRYLQQRMSNWQLTLGVKAQHFITTAYYITR